MSRRYPLDALVRASGLTEYALGQKVGMDGTTLKRARERGLVESAADRYAIRAGLHPYVVWPEMPEHVIEDTDRECAAPDCDDRFSPRRKNHRYCSSTCQQRTFKRDYQRRLYQSDSEYRAKFIEKNRAYRQQADRALKMTQARYRAARRQELADRQRRYYEANRERILARQREYDRRRRDAA